MKKLRSRSVNAFGIILCVIATVILGLTAYFVSKWPQSALAIGGTAVLSFVLCAVLLRIFTGLIQSKGYTKKKLGPVLGSIMYDKINSLTEPALICDSNCKIVWYNRFLHTAAHQKKVLGAAVSTLFPYEIREPETVKKHLNDVIEFKGEKYVIQETEIKNGETVYRLLVLRNVTELERLKKFINDDDKVVAYVIVDNLEELLQFEQEKYREAAAKVEDHIRSWAQSVNGLIKEYEKDKFIFVFNNADLEVFKEDKFSILDRVREIRVGNGNIPVTVSIGIAKVKGTLSDKEKAAHVALDMALQRGGDQAVLKLDDEIKFYGGKTNAVHKRTKVRARVVANELASRISSAGNVIVMAHKYPDYDAFGASVGIAHLAMFCGVRVNVVTNFKDPNVKKCMRFFDGDENYKGVFVDGAKGLDLVRSDTLLVIVDVNNIAMFESAAIARNVKDIIIIDHHRKTAEYENEPILSYIEASASSASEIVSEILEQALPTHSLRQNEANMLYAGILLDTKQFTKGTGTKTYAAAMYLRENSASYESVQDLFKTNINEYRQEAKFGEKINIYRNCIAIALNQHGVDSSDRILAARVADNLLMLEDVAASFALVQIGNTVHISARSNGTINVQLILEELNGGGRFDAAGAQVKESTIESTLKRLKAAIDNYINPEA